MKTKKVLLVLIVLFRGLFSLEAQTLKNVTRDPESFKTEVANLLMTADKKESKPFVEENWNINITPGAFEQEQWNKIYDITDFMIKKRIRAIPYLMEFAEILTMKSTNPATENQFEAILASLWDVQKKTNQRISRNTSNRFLFYIKTGFFIKVIRLAGARVRESSN